jgi:hypothetical protein
MVTRPNAAAAVFGRRVVQQRRKHVLRGRGKRGWLLHLPERGGSGPDQVDNIGRDNLRKRIHKVAAVVRHVLDLGLRDLLISRKRPRIVTTRLGELVVQAIEDRGTALGKIRKDQGRE